MLRKIQQLRNLHDKVVLLRVDFNVPLKRKQILDDSRLRAALPTIAYLREKGAKVILMTHIGRPEGKIVPSLKVDPLVTRLSELLEFQVKKLDTKNWKLSDTNKARVLAEIYALQPGDVAMMENIRFSPYDELYDPYFSQELATLADIFVFDGFGVAHRNSASVNGVAAFLPSYAGLLLQQEVKVLDKVLHPTVSRVVAVLGGAKMETKIPVLKKLLPKVDTVLIGGCLLTTYLWAKGYQVGDSLIEKKFKQQILTACKPRKVITALDVVVGTMDGSTHRVVDIKKVPHQICKKGEAILDIGPKTIRNYARVIKASKMLVWNGAMGYYEQPPYHIGTLSIARLIATVSRGTSFGVIGGGETVDAMQQTHMIAYVDHVSTGGGAMLSYLAGDIIPGIQAVST